MISTRSVRCFTSYTLDVALRASWPGAQERDEIARGVTRMAVGLPSVKRWVAA